MSSHQVLPSLLPLSEQGGSLIHTVNIAPLSLLLASMDPAPTANPHAQLVSECFEDCPALDTPARNRSPTTPPDLKPVKGSEWDGVRRPAVDIEESHSREGKVAVVYYDEGCEEGNMPAGSRSWLPSLTGQSGDQGQQTYFVKNMTKLNLVGDCTLPGLKELGLDMYVEKRD